MFPGIGRPFCLSHFPLSKPLPFCPYSFSLHDLPPMHKCALLIKANESLYLLVLHIPFLLSLPFSMTCLWLLRFGFVVSHCCTLTRKGNHQGDQMSSNGNKSTLFSWWLNWETFDSEAKFLSGKQKCFDLRQKKNFLFVQLFVFEQQNCFRNNCFPRG